MGPLTPPGGQQAPPEDSQQGASPTPGGGFPSAAPAQTDPRAAQATEWILQIVQLSRRIGMIYPGTLPEVRSINNACQAIQPKILASHPASEPMSPPV